MPAPFRSVILSCLLLAPALASAGEFDWPQFRGPDRTDVSRETGLLQSWPKAGPPLVWTIDNAGEGYSSFAIVDGRLYTMGARDNTTYLLCYNTSDGSQAWATEMGPDFKEGHGDGPRGTPTIDGDRLYAMTGNGRLICARCSDGGKVWTVDMQDLGGKPPHWGYTESVLVDGNKVLCTPGGPAGTVAAIDKSTGKVIWQSNGATAGAQYVSMIKENVNGGDQYIQLTQKTLFGISPEDGKVLWTADWKDGRTAVIPTPLFKDNSVYITSGYSAGCQLVKVNADNSVEEVYKNKNMKNHHGGVILLGDHVYGYSDGGLGWVCQNFKTGEIVWQGGRNAGKKGAVTYADRRLYCVEERSGDVLLLEAAPTDYKELGRFTLPKQSNNRKGGMVWTHPVVSNGKLYLRDQEYIFCYDVKAH